MKPLILLLALVLPATATNVVFILTDDLGYLGEVGFRDRLVAALLREQTMVGNPWIAQQLRPVVQIRHTPHLQPPGDPPPTSSVVFHGLDDSNGNTK